MAKKRGFKMKGFEPYTGASPMKWDWGKALDRVQTGLTAAGMVPGLGNLADMANVAVSGGRAAHAKLTGDTEAAKRFAKEGAINAAAAVPGAGLAVGGAKLASKGVQKGAEVLKTGSKVAKKVKKVKKGKEVAKDVKKEIEDPNRAKTSNLGGYGKA
tara:strand:- start:15 stop:485 length:471 start_codon:yes stop_codon:yes gene_type:complete